MDYSPQSCKESDMTESLLHRFLVIFKVTGYGRMHSELPPLSIFSMRQVVVVIAKGYYLGAESDRRK